MRRHFCPPLSTVHLDHLWRVDGEHPVGVDRHAEQPRVGLEEGREGKREKGGQKGREKEREGKRERSKGRG